MPNSDAPWTWGNSTIFAGITKLSQLGIDVNKNWLGQRITALADPVDAQDAATKAYALAQVALEAGLRATAINAEAGLRATADALEAGMRAAAINAEAIARSAADALLSKFVWKDTSEEALSLPGQTSDIAWTELDLTALTSNNAKIVLLWVFLFANVVPGGGLLGIYFRKKGTTPSWNPEACLYYYSGDRDYPTMDTLIICGVDTARVLEYGARVDTGGNVDISVGVLGYIE